MKRTGTFFAIAVAFVPVLLGISSPLYSQDANDPFESFNRRVHGVNIALDKSIVRPVSFAYAENVNDGLRQMINNFAENLSVPGDILNNVLQGEFQSGLQNTGKFLINSTLGFAGLGTPAEDLGIGGDESDFGATLHTWGVAEGFYVELPLFGPSTSRDATGKIVDWVLNPLAPLIEPPVNYYTTSSMIAKAMDTRVAYAGAFDSVLYDSIDSYSQSKLIYLQTRRFSLGGRDEDVYDDPYEDLYGTE